MTTALLLKSIIAALSAGLLTAFVILFIAAMAHRDSDVESRNEH